MDRNELLHLMPVNGQDVEGARRIIELGFPTVGPILRDLMKLMRIFDSPVADLLAHFFARLGEPAAEVIGEGLLSKQILLKQRILLTVLPEWPAEAIALVRQELATVAAHQDLCDNDLRSMVLLASHRLVDRKWLNEFLRTKRRFMSERRLLLHEVESFLDRLD